MPTTHGALEDRPMRIHLLTACLGLAFVATAPRAMADEPPAMEAGSTQAVGEGDERTALDLSLPQSERAGYRNDPPGTWYGDTSGVPADGGNLLAKRRHACPTAPDGKETDITGEFEAGIGYAKRGGNLNWQAATVNYCKEYATEDGGSGTVNVQLNVGNYDGPAMPYGPVFGPLPPGHHAPGWGPYGESYRPAPAPRPGGRR